MALWLIIVELSIHLWFRPAERKAATRAGWELLLPSNGQEFREIPISETIRAMLRYDEGHKAEWRDDSGAPWQLFYFRWLPADTRYRAAVTCAEARGHAPDGCLRSAGMVLQTNLGVRTMNVNAIQLRVGVERFLDRGRPFHVFSGYWEPNEWVPQGVPTTRSAVRAVLHALRTHDRGRNEKRVFKLGVWGKATDAAAQESFERYLRAMIPPAS